MARKLRLLAFHVADAGNRTMSYQLGYPEQLGLSPLFETRLVNLASVGRTLLWSLSWDLRLGRFDAIVLLHSVFSNSCYLQGRMLDLVVKARQPKVFFPGNEYKLMPEKMAFAERIGATVLATQMNHPRTLALYRDRLPGVTVMHLPNTGIDPGDYPPGPPLADRPIDIGYRSNDSVHYLGNDERRELAQRFAEALPGHGLSFDISLDPAKRLEPRQWLAFLNSCKGQIGNEPGGDYFELTDATRNAVNAYVEANPQADFQDIRRRFFDGYADPVPGRIIGSRQIEAAAAKTVQILLEGDYGGYLQAGIHYIALRKDFSNLDQVIQQFKDSALCERIREQAYQTAMDSFTYDKLFARLRDALLPLC